LGHQVFADKAALARLEAIVHPAVAARRAAFLEAHHDKRAVVFDIPLLFERGGHEAVDMVVVVSAPEEVQRARVLARPGMTVQKFEHIYGLQLHDTHKRERADHVIDTATSLEETRAQVQALIASL
jgi:dephospho-CoA kinase